MQRMMITLLIAFAVGIVLGKVMLPVLHKLKFGQNIYELAPEAHKKKQGTPTMGGLVIAGAAIVAALIMNDYSQPLWQNMLLAMLVMALGNLCIGFVDDMTKIRRGKNGGLTPSRRCFSRRCWHWRSPATAISTRRSATSSRCRFSAWNGTWASGISRL